VEGCWEGSARDGNPDFYPHDSTKTQFPYLTGSQSIQRAARRYTAPTPQSSTNVELYDLASPAHLTPVIVHIIY
jgi:hypothetical protein